MRTHCVYTYKRTGNVDIFNNGRNRRFFITLGIHFCLAEAQAVISYPSIDEAKP